MQIYKGSDSLLQLPPNTELPDWLVHVVSCFICSCFICPGLSLSSCLGVQASARGMSQHRAAQ